MFLQSVRVLSLVSTQVAKKNQFHRLFIFDFPPIIPFQSDGAVDEYELDEVR